MNQLLKFLRHQKLMNIACHNGNDIWSANVYVGADDRGSIYFVSPEATKHSEMILKNPNVAFSFAWFDPMNVKNRKAIQGLGTCRIAAGSGDPTHNEVEIGVRLHNENFPEFKEKITIDWIQTNEWGSKIWVLKPTFMKYWDDEVYGEEESEEFTIE